MSEMKISYDLFLVVLLITATTLLGQSQEPSISSTGEGTDASSVEPQTQMDTSTGEAGITGSAYWTTSPDPPPTSTSTPPASPRTAGTTYTPSAGILQPIDCKSHTSLKTNCSSMLSVKEMEFFGNDTSIIGVLSKIITPRTVYALQEQCVPGNWCLADSYQKELSEGKDHFYTTPICQSDGLWECLEIIEMRRKDCNESELYFLMSTIGLMCDMEAIDGGIIRTECFTRSMEALHVLYSDLSRNIQDAEKKEKCSNYKKQMTNAYACAVDACDMEQRVFLEDFGPWSHIATAAKDVFNSCNMTLQCQGGYPTQSAISAAAATTNVDSQEKITELNKELDDQESTEENKLNEKLQDIESEIAAEEAVAEVLHDLFDQTTMSYQMPVTTDRTGEGNINEQGMDIPDSNSDSDADDAFVYGMVTVTVVAVISLTLIGVMTFKRFSRMRRNYKMGYSQMSEEESRMLKNEYN